MPSSFFKFCFFSLSILGSVVFSCSLWAGPVNSSDGFPFALANAAGDRLALGDLKALVYWQEFGSSPAAAFHWRSGSKTEQRFTGGIADRNLRDKSHPAAIACSESETFLYAPERSPAAPAGQWQKIAADLGSASRRCAMQTDGTFAELELEAGRVHVNRQTTLALPEKNPMDELIAGAGGFMVLSPTGDAWSLYEDKGLWKLSKTWRHPFAGYQSTSRMTANQHFMLMADPDLNALAALESSDTGPRLGLRQRLPVNPCEAGQVCGLSLASDDSWLISGYWGHYLGRDQQFKRLNIPISVSRGRGGVAIAHSGAAGLYIYLGADDGDQGTLPGLSQNLADAAVRTQSSAWMIWRGMDANLSSSPSLLQLELPKNSAQLAPQFLQMEVWKGVLPEPIPSDWIAWEAALPFAAPPWQSTPSASMDDDRWFLESIGAPRAWQLAAENGLIPAKIHAAVIDSGIDPAHPLLQRQLFHQALEIPDNGLDDDGNGFVDDVWGYDFVEEDALPQDDFGHGTHVAGLLAAHDPREELSRSPAPNLQLTVVKALDRYGKSNSIDLARALLYAKDSGAQLINCSWGGGPDSQALRDAFAALRKHGIVVFSSAGNDKLNTDQNPEVPKTYPGVLSIAAYNRQGALASFSNFGPHTVRFIAPGEAISSSIKGGGLGEKSGTSMASPLAAASFAWLWGELIAKFPEKNYLELSNRADQLLCSTALQKGLESLSLCGQMRMDRAMQSLLLP